MESHKSEIALTRRAYWDILQLLAHRGDADWDVGLKGCPPLQDDGISPSRAASRAEREARVQKILSSLRPHEREVLVLRLDGMPLSEIAAALKISERVARMRYRRALNRLLTILSDMPDRSESEPPRRDLGQPARIATLAQTPVVSQPGDRSSEPDSVGIPPLGRAWLSLDRYQDAALIAFYAGLAGAGLFTYFAMSPAWIGFLVGFLPMSALMALAYSSHG